MASMASIIDLYIAHLLSKVRTHYNGLCPEGHRGSILTCAGEDLTVHYNVATWTVERNASPDTYPMGAIEGWAEGGAHSRHGLCPGCLNLCC
jgi:hypothetical protein